MAKTWIAGMVVLGACHGGAAGSGSSTAVVPIVWHSVDNVGTRVAIGADGAIDDQCGPIGRYDRAAGTVRVTRGKPQELPMKDVKIDGDRIQIGAMDPFDVRGGHLMSHGHDWGALDGYDGSADAGPSLAALLLAAGSAPCQPPMSLAVAGGDHVLAIQADGTIVDGKAKVAQLDEHTVGSPAGELGHFSPDALEKSCTNLEPNQGPYRETYVAISIGDDGAVSLVGGGPIGKLAGYQNPRQASGSGYALAIVALATLTPEPPPGSPPPATVCP